MGFTAVNSVAVVQHEVVSPREELPKVRTPKSCALQPKLPQVDKPALAAGPAHHHLFPQQRSRSFPPLEAGVFKDLRSRAKAQPPGTGRNFVPGVQPAPVLYPTPDEFADANSYISSVRALGERFGMVKIVPPPSWDPPFSLDTELFWFKTRTQIFNQHDAGASIQESFHKALVMFHDVHLQGISNFKLPFIDRRPLNLYQLQRLVQLRGGFKAVCRRKLWAQVGRELGYAGSTMSSLSTSLRTAYQKLIFPFDEYIKQHGVDLAASPRVVKCGISKPGTPPKANEVILPDGITITMDCTIPQGNEATQFPTVSNAGQMYTRCPDEPPRDPASGDSRFATYNLRQFFQKSTQFRDTYFNKNLDEYQVEQEYWKLLSTRSECVEVEEGTSFTGCSVFPQPGQGTQDGGSWNFHVLPLSPESYLRYVNSDVPSMSSPHIQVGMLFSTSVWHLEDFYSYGIYISHLGAAQTWYSVPPEFQEHMLKLVPVEDNQFMISPQKLADRGIPVFAVDQGPNEIVVVFPKAFTSSFSQGFNLRESVSYLPCQDWLDYGLQCMDLYAQQKIMPPFSLGELVASVARSRCQLQMLEKLLPVVDKLEHREVTTAAMFSDLEQGSCDGLDAAFCSSTASLPYFSWIEAEAVNVNIDAAFYATSNNRTAVTEQRPKTFKTRFAQGPREYFAHLRASIQKTVDESSSKQAALLSYVLRNPKLDAGELRQLLSNCDDSQVSGLRASFESLLDTAARLDHESAFINKLVSFNRGQGFQFDSVAGVTDKGSLSLERLQVLLNDIHKSEVENPQQAPLVAAAQAYVDYGEAAGRFVASFQGSYQALCTRFYDLEVAAAHLLFSLPLHNCVDVLRNSAALIASTINTLSTGQASLELVKVLLHDRISKGVPEDCTFMNNLWRQLSFGEGLSAHINAMASSNVDEFSEQAYASILEKARTSMITHVALDNLKRLDVIFGLKRLMSHADPCERPRLSFIRQNSLASADVFAAAQQCETWASAFRLDPRMMLAQAQYVEQPAARPPGWVPLPVPLRVVEAHLEHGLSLRVVPDDIHILVELHLTLQQLQRSKTIGELQAAGFLVD